ncbi:MAG: hypothetical protein V9G23_12885 [Giesbergeria sp.]
MPSVAECEDDVARRFGVQRWPSLVFFRDGQLHHHAGRNVRLERLSHPGRPGACACRPVANPASVYRWSHSAATAIAIEPLDPP